MSRDSPCTSEAAYDELHSESSSESSVSDSTPIDVRTVNVFDGPARLAVVQAPTTARVMNSTCQGRLLQNSADFYSPVEAEDAITAPYGES